MDLIDRKIVIAMQDEFPLVPEPYRELAGRIGISEEELLTRLQKQKQRGCIRKMGAVLRHREVGYTANALCAWIVEEERLAQVGSIMAAHPAVTHCYARKNAPQWPYNFYVMLHSQSREACCALAAELAEQAEERNYTMLFSTREWKKTSMRYFAEHKSV